MITILIALFKCSACVFSSMERQRGADILMVKPALSYLDIISDVKRAFKAAVSAHNVSRWFTQEHGLVGLTMNRR